MAGRIIVLVGRLISDLKKWYCLIFEISIAHFDATRYANNYVWRSEDNIRQEDLSKMCIVTVIILFQTVLSVVVRDDYTLTLSPLPHISHFFSINHQSHYYRTLSITISSIKSCHGQINISLMTSHLSSCYDIEYSYFIKTGQKRGHYEKSIIFLNIHTYVYSLRYFPKRYVRIDRDECMNVV